MNYLLTGSTGFLGNHIKGFLEKNGKVVTIGRGGANDIEVSSITEKIQKLPEVKIDVVVHAAGKAHMIPKTEEEKSSFFQINMEGTKNLCDWINQWSSLPKTFIFISTVAVYGIEEGVLIDESYVSKGNSPYAESKIKAEAYLKNWANMKGVQLVILRLPLIAGINPPGNLGAMMKAINKGYYMRIGSGSAKRSMVLASDIAQAIPNMIGCSGIFNLTDGLHPSFAELDCYIANHFHKKIKVIPDKIASLIAKIGDFIPGFPMNSYRLNKMKTSLTFSDDKARHTFNWNPKSVIGNIFN